MAGVGPPSTTFLVASAKSWMPTFVGMTMCTAAEEFDHSAGWYKTGVASISTHVRSAGTGEDPAPPA